MKRRTIATTLLLATGLFLAGLTISVVFAKKATQAQMSRPEFTAIVLARKNGRDGRLGVLEITTCVQRSDGSQAYEKKRYMPFNDVNYRESRWVLDITTGREISIDPFTESLSTLPIPQKKIALLQTKPNPSCVDSSNPALTSYETSPEISDILGFQVVKVSWDLNTKTEGKVHSDRWMAPDLGCYTLKEEASLEMPGLGASRNVSEVVSIQLGTPDPKYFQIPLNYKERLPSEIFAEAAKRRGESGCPKCETDTAKALDESFVRRKTAGK